MDLHGHLSRSHSKKTTRLLANWIGNDPDRFSHFLDIFLHGEKGIVQRASWVISEVGCVYPELFEPHWTVILNALEHPVHDAVSRNIFKVIADTGIELPEEEEGRLVHLAFEAVADPKRPVAIQVHAMSCIANLLSKYPELAFELKEIVEQGMEMDECKAAYRSRGRSVLKRIAKLEITY